MEPLSPPAPPTARVWIAIESLLATIVTLYLAVRLDRPSVWVLIPVAMLVLSRRDTEDLGLEPRLTPPRPAVHLGIGAVILGIYAVVHVLWMRWALHATLSPQWPADPIWLLIAQLVVVAFPEELFFRGYLQSNFDRIFTRRYQVFGARVGPALVVQAALFAICHLVDGDWTRLRVFFFGLLAGWLRERSGSIAGPIVYHGIANFWYATVAASLLRVR